MSSSAFTKVMNRKCTSTEVEVHHFTFDWIVKDFKFLPQEYEEYIDSPIFRINDNDEETWKLQFFPRGEVEGKKNSVSLYLCLASQDAAKTKVKVHWQLSIFTSKGMACHESFIYTYKKVIGYGGQAMIGISKLLDLCGADDSITVRCEINIPQRIITKPFNPVSFDLHRGQLSEHFSQLFNDSRFCDVTIIVGKEELPAHKLVLAARSTVFAAMFEHKEMEENRKNEVKIEDLEPATVKGMLEFLYTDKVTDLEILARELLKASDKYDLHRLKTMCEEVIYKTLTHDNAAEILVLSDLYHSDKLKEYVIAFIDDHLSSVFQSESYKTMVETYPALLNGLVSLIVTRRDSKKQS